MKNFGAIVSAVVLAFILAAPVVIFSGCDRTKNAAWTTSLSGQGGTITGASVGLAAAQPVPTPWPVVTEQLEKGNEAKVAAQVTAQAQADAVRLSYGDILPAVTATPCVGGACLMATPVAGRSAHATSKEERSSSGSAAWYNGFLP